MAKFFISALIVFFISVGCRAAANDVSDEFQRLRNLDNKTLLDRGYKYIEEAKYDSAMVYYSMVVNRYYSNSYKKSDILDIIKGMQNLSIIYMSFSFDYKKSYEYLLDAKELAEKNGCTEKLPNIYNCLANILQLSKGDSESADMEGVTDMLRKAFYSAAKQKDYGVMSISLNNLITLCFGQDDQLYDISKELSEFRKICKNVKSNDVKLSLLMCRAYDEAQKGKVENAVKLLRSVAAGTADSPLAYRGILSCQGMITTIYVTHKRYREAIESDKEALRIAESNKSTDYIVSLSHDLSSLYKEIGDTVMANRYELKYLRNNNVLMSAGHLSSVKNVKFMRELNKANEQVRELSEKRRLQNIMFLCALAVIVVIGGLLYRIYRANRKIRSNNRHLYTNYVEMLAKEEQARLQRETNEQRIRELEQQLRESESPKKPVAADTDTDGMPQKAKYQNSRLTEEDTKALYSAILKVMENSDEIYKLGFNVDGLSELVHSRPRYVSQAINQEYGSNFNSLLNEYRIKEACRRLGGNPDYANMTIEGIAESVGFKSRTSFGTLFKSVTGLSPSAYQKIAHEKS